MKPFKGPDQVVYRYLELLERMADPRGMNPIQGEGYVYAHKCDSCASTKRRELFGYDNQGRTVRSAYVCSRCGRPWRVWKAYLMRNEFDPGRRPTFVEDAYAELGTMAKWLGGLSHWEIRIYPRYLFGFSGGDYEGLARFCARRFRRAKRKWTEKRCRYLVASARGKLRDRIDRSASDRLRGLLETLNP